MNQKEYTRHSSQIWIWISPSTTTLNPRTVGVSRLVQTLRCRVRRRFWHRLRRMILAPAPSLRPSLNRMSLPTSKNRCPIGTRNGDMPLGEFQGMIPPWKEGWSLHACQDPEQ